MTHNNFKIREIQPIDNPKIASAIRKVLIEFGVPKVGTAYADVILDTLYEYYNSKNCIYYIIEKDGEIFGGAGIKQLDNFEGNVCELQKMYFLPEARGIGLGSRMMAICLEKAKEFGFEQCYLETMPYMVDARKLYRKVGFKNLEAPMGDTGHYSCNLWMLKKL
ncbi:MAG: GNAT family N-acetyltransferase [Lutibacter sp.]|uniref:GNAT family N-acetyltransferase n=1 Tax=Lutibacter sp. TaxID=1925666 RepID=UPI0017B34F09|nr:GNAT family N-acetyltransferase [Lutibacter sp.]MBT8317302.1 GNAT family N-acetyltransferase [Lutibacter sp.]NNJ58161.1 GNAT family N-acetyltransferase [Lutibacter sp.]